MRLVSEFSIGRDKKKGNTKDKVERVAAGVGSVAIGQQAIRSGVPRALGVRLESHSTSRANAREIMKGGGYIDPDRGGSGATKDLTNTTKTNNRYTKAAENKNQAFLNRAKGNVYITGSNNASKEASNNVGKLRGIFNNPVGEAIYKKGQRAFYRGQSASSIDREDIKNQVKNWKKSDENQTKLKQIKDELKENVEKLKNNKTKKSQLKRTEPPAVIKQRINRLQDEIRRINSGASETKRLTDIAIEKKKPQSIVKGLLGRGKSLYVGGSDDFFDKNFVPDPDDLVALKTNKKIQVSGNRLSATANAIKREGLGNLMKANKGRVAAGSAILAGGLGASALLAKKALGSNSTKKKKKRPKFIGGYKK